MPILLSCDCGKRIKVRDEDAGKRVKCPGCNAVLRIPAPEGVTVEPPRPAPKEVPRPKRHAPAVEELPEVLPADEGDAARYGLRAEKPGPEARRPRRRRPRRLDVRRYDSDSAPKGGFRYSVLGGLIMMAGAVVWFGLGLAFGILFWYPPILFVLGAIAFIKGLASGNVAGEDD